MPVFTANSRSNRKHPTLRTTKQALGKKLHIYTVVNAINDKNVLPFRIDYYNTTKTNNADNSLIEDIDDEKIILAEGRVSKVVHYMLTYFDQKAMRNYSIYKFNTITNIKDAAKGYDEKKVLTVKFLILFLLCRLLMLQKYGIKNLSVR